VVKPHAVSVRKIEKENGILEKKLPDIIPAKAIKKCKFYRPGMQPVICFKMAVG
jgi:hypothetical protein